MEIKITNYSCYDNGIVSETENVCNIIDKMIRLTAKVTERWASDIVYDINELTGAVKNKKSIDEIIFFRENGIITMETNKLTAERYNDLLCCFTPIQI